MIEVNKFINGMKERKTYIQPYWLTLDDGVINLGAAGSGTASAIKFLTCTGDITLVLFNLYAKAVAADGSDVSSAVTVELFDAKTSRSMQSQPMSLANCGGTGEDPFRLPAPWMIEPQTQIRAQLRNVSSESAMRVYMTLHGVAIYTGSSFHGSTLTNKKLIAEAVRMYEAMSTPQLIPASPQG